MACSPTKNIVLAFRKVIGRAVQEGLRRWGGRWCKNWANAWNTSQRFGRDQHCPFGCNAGNDSLLHFAQCMTLEAVAASLFPWRSAPADRDAALRRWFFVQLDFDTFLSQALLAEAILAAHAYSRRHGRISPAQVLLVCSGHIGSLQRASAGIRSFFMQARHWTRWRGLTTRCLPGSQIAGAGDVNEWALYCDGSFTGRPGVGGVVFAGWGVALFSAVNVAGQPRAAWHGPVETEASGFDFLGATVASNNTGELTAMAEALRAAASDEFRQSGQTVFLRYDSTYAADVVRGIKKATANSALVRRLRRLLALAEAQGPIVFEHIFSHRGDFGNELADKLAKRGSTGRKIRA